jgi:hypothetical protein
LGFVKGDGNVNISPSEVLSVNMTDNIQSGSMIEIRNNILEIKDREVSGFVLTPTTPALTIEPVVSHPLYKAHIFNNTNGLSQHQHQFFFITKYCM